MKNYNYLHSCKTVILYLLGMSFTLAGITSCNSKPPENSLVAQTQRGKALFQQHCVQCHGNDGRGLKLDSLNTKAADLTMIKRSRGLKDFPLLEIANIIDGRKMVEAHGTRPMPVWGEVFSEKEHLDEKEVKGKMAELIAYLMTLQE